MKFVNKKQFKTFFSGCKGCFLTLAKHPFISCFFIFILALILSFVLYYHYGFLAEEKDIEKSSSPFELKEEDYQEVLKVWKEKKNSFEEADDKDYPDLFKQFIKEED